MTAIAWGALVLLTCFFVMFLYSLGCYCYCWAKGHRWATWSNKCLRCGLRWGSFD